MSESPLPPPFPVPDPTLSFWLTEPSPLANHRTTEDLPTECDICIIGSGYSGVATAYHLLNSEDGVGEGRKIVMLEAREACSGATGRNGGHLKPDTYYNILKYTEKYGLEAAAEYSKFEASQVLAVKNLVEKENIDCDFHLTRAIDVYLDEDHANAVEGIYRELLKRGLGLGDVQFTGRKDAERISGIKGAKSCFSFTAAHIWPYKLVTHLLSLCLQSKHLNLQTNTPVTSISSTLNSSNKYTITTSRGPILAQKVIFATNAYTPAILPEFNNKIVPVRGLCSRIITPDGGSPHLVNTYSIRYGPALYDYLIPRADGSIIVGGAKPDFWSDKSHWYGVFDDSKLIEPAKGYFDGLMQRTFRGWEGSGARVDRVWSGIMGYSSDFIPYVGEVPNKPNQFIIAGFSGHGMPLIFLAAKGIADMVRGKKFEETGVPRLFKPTLERLEREKNEILDL